MKDDVWLDTLRKTEAHFSRAAKTYERSSPIQREIGERMLLLVESLRPSSPRAKSPQKIWDVGCGTGHLSVRLAKRFPLSHVVASDISWRMISYAKAHNHALNLHYEVKDMHVPFLTKPCDLIVANASLHWTLDLASLLNTLHKQLLSQGLGVFSIYLHRTYQQLRPYATVHPLNTPHEVITFLGQAGFSPYFILEEERLETYFNYKDFIIDQKKRGTTTVLTPPKSSYTEQKENRHQLIKAFEMGLSLTHHYGIYVVCKTRSS